MCGSSFQAMLVPFFQDRYEDFFCRSRISRALKYNKLSSPQMWRDHLSCVTNIGEVWLTIFVQRCRHADDDRVHLRNLRGVGGCNEALGASLPDLCRRDPVDV